jgi:hypothetical protein
VTNCVESSSCNPVNPLDVLNIFDVWFGTGFSLLVMGLIIGVITLAIYVRTKSLPFLTILGIYEIAAFGSILTSKYISSQYHILEYVIIFGGATALMMMILRLVKE